MISFERFIMDDNSPIYQQIVKFIKLGIAAGAICDQAEMPSRRVLSALLGVNPNTIQKAYRILEEEGIICSHSGAKSYVVIRENQVECIRKQLLEEETLAWISSVKQMGISREEAVRVVEAMWEGQNEAGN